MEILEIATLKVPPPLLVKDARKKIEQFNNLQEQWIIVLDDDPTGCQTIYNVPLLTTWEKNILERTVRNHRFFFILTNTRACSPDEAARSNKEIAERLLQIIEKDALKIISRSDSTLRGHFNTEVTTLQETAGPFDGLIIIPFFKEGARLTIGDIHYISDEEKMVPVHLTEFASDPDFGYKNSYLPAWLEEKTNGYWKKEDVVSVSLETIRTSGVEAVYEKLVNISGSRPVIINALSDHDVEVAVLAICMAEQQGKRFLYRSGASFVKIRAGIADAPLYSLPVTFKKGLVIVGSHVKKTTTQLQPLLQDPLLQKFEIVLQKVLSTERDAYLGHVLQLVEKALQENQSVLVYTEREYALHHHPDKLHSGRVISDFLSELVRSLQVRPDFIIAKGGITSHDIAVKGLLMKEAMVLGQIAPGVPIWQSPADSKFSNLLYVVFPGNVGNAATLQEFYTKFLQ